MCALAFVAQTALAASDETVRTSHRLPETAGKYFTLNRNGNQNAFLQERADGSLGAAAFDEAQKCFWQFEATGNEDCYYIRNATSGLYVQSTKVALSTAVTMGATPVEFKIATDETSGAATNGFYYLASTDQEVSNATDGTLGLNYSNGNVLAFHIKTGRGNSYWDIKEAAYDYEEAYFNSVPSLDEAADAQRYTLLTPAAKMLMVGTDDALLTAEPVIDPRGGWFFVGTRNSAGGFLIASAAYPDRTLNRTAEGTHVLEASDAPTRWFVEQVEHEGANYLTFIPFELRGQASGHLIIGGDSLFMLDNYRSSYGSLLGLYNQPCGVRTNDYLTAASITGSEVLSELRYAVDGAPSSYYTLYTLQQAVVCPGTTFTVSLTRVLTGTTYHLYAYFDWNGDGTFETMQEIKTGRRLTKANINVPADAREGRTRMRIRLTENTFSGAEEDVEGATYDFILHVAPARSERILSVAANVAERGAATIVTPTAEAGSLTAAYDTPCTVRATAWGDAEFICWRQGREVVSTEAEYSFTLTEDKALTAVFSPLTIQLPDGLSHPAAEMDASQLHFSLDGSVLTVTHPEAPRAVCLYNVAGAPVRTTSESSFSVEGLPAGTYIIKVYGAKGCCSRTVLLP